MRIGRLVHPFNPGRRAAVRRVANPFISALTVARLVLFRNVATLPGHFVHKSERRTRDWGFHIRPCLLMKPVLRLRLTPRKHSSLPFQMPLPSPAATAFSRQRRQERAHYTLQAKSYCERELSPVGNRTTKQAGYPHFPGA